MENKKTGWCCCETPVLRRRKSLNCSLCGLKVTRNRREEHRQGDLNNSSNFNEAQVGEEAFAGVR